MDYRIKTRPKIPRNKYGYIAPSSTGGVSISNTSTNTTVEGGNAEYATTAGQADKLTNTVKLWGNDFNGTQDVDGDITVDAINVDNINPKSDDYINLNGDVYVSNNLYVDDGLYVTNDGTFNGDINASNANISDTLTANDVNCDNVNCNDTVSTHSLFSDSITNSGKITTKVLDVTTINSTTINNSDTITTKNLNVTGSAHFFELIIDKIKSAGGSALFTPADGFIIDKITVRAQSDDVPYAYTLYWKSRDGEGNARKNMWKVGDQALCMSFNQAKVGTSFNVSNKYYWALVIDVLQNDVQIDGTYYNGITISATVYDGTVNPEIGDNIVMCGHRKQIGETITEASQRGSAIYIAAYNGLDSGIKAPFIAQYKGINTFELPKYRQSYFDAVGANFVGNFTLTPQQISDIADKVNIHDPYISDGTDGFTLNHWIVWDSTTGQYKDSGILAQGTNGYTPIKGVDYNDGNDSVIYKLYPITEQAIVKANENLDITLDYLVYKQEGNKAPVDMTSYIMDRPYPDWWYIIFEDNVSSSHTNVPLAKYNGTYKTKYFTDKLTNIRSITVKLYNGNQLEDSRTVQIIYEPSATFEINQELGSIKSRVTNTETGLTSITTRVSTVEQTASGLTSRVGAVETSVSGVTDRLTTVEQTASGLTTRVGAVETTAGNALSKATQVEQTANGLTSTVSKMNLMGSRVNLLPESNLNGRCNNIRYAGHGTQYNTIVKNAFNGMNSYRAFIPARSSDLCYYGVHWGGDNTKAIKLSTSKTYTLSVWAKANVANSWCMIECHKTTGQYGIRHSGYSQAKYFVPETTWTQYTWEFTPKGEYNEIFILTYNDRGSTVSTTNCDVEFCMPLLTENGVTEYSLSPDDKDVVQGNLLDNTNNFVKDGNLYKVNGTISNYLFSNNKQIYSAPNGDYENVLEWLIPNNKIASNTDYVVSFMAKTNKTNSRVEVIFYHDADPNGDGQVRYSETSDGTIDGYYTFVTLSAEWSKYYVHYHTKESIYNAVKLLLRVKDGDKAYIAQPKLEIGANDTEWTNSTNDYDTPSNVSSKIEQSATAITLSVSNDLRDTGINIQDGVISLNASNTVVSDNLSVGSLKTTGEQASIEIKDGAMKVFGDNKEQPNIIFGIDDNGYAVLSYYDNNGTLLYNLGPDGIMKTFTETYNKFLVATQFIRIDNGTTLNNTFNSLDIAGGTPYYKFIEGYKMIGNVKEYKISKSSVASTYHLSYYSTNGLSGIDGIPTGTRMPNGWYFNGLESPTVSDKYKIVEAINISAGKQVNKMNVYVVYSNNVWKLTDQNFNTVTNKTPTQYMELTKQ